MQFLSGFELYSRWVPQTFYVYGYTTRTRTPISGYLKVSNERQTEPGTGIYFSDGWAKLIFKKLRYFL